MPRVPFVLLALLLLPGCDLFQPDGPDALPGFFAVIGFGQPPDHDPVTFTVTVENVVLQDDRPTDGLFLTRINLRGPDPAYIGIEPMALSPSEAPFEAGTTYTFTSAVSPPFMVQTALEAQGPEGLAYFGVGGSLQFAWDHLPEGLTLRLEEAGYSGFVDECGVRQVPQRLVLTGPDGSVALLQGQTGDLGPYRVRVLVARTLEPASDRVSCSDYSPYAVSLSLWRR